MIICLFFLKCSLEYNATEKHVSSSPAVARGLSALGSLNSNTRDFPRTLELALMCFIYLFIDIAFIQTHNLQTIHNYLSKFFLMIDYSPVV